VRGQQHLSRYAPAAAGPAGYRVKCASRPGLCWGRQVVPRRASGHGGLGSESDSDDSSDGGGGGRRNKGLPAALSDDDDDEAFLDSLDADGKVRRPC